MVDASSGVSQLRHGCRYGLRFCGKHGFQHCMVLPLTLPLPGAKATKTETTDLQKCTGLSRFRSLERGITTIFFGSCSVNQEAPTFKEVCTSSGSSCHHSSMLHTATGSFYHSDAKLHVGPIHKTADRPV